MRKSDSETERIRKLHNRLAEFASQHGIKGKGPLSVVLVLTNTAMKQGPPFRKENFLSPKKGQVAGLGGGAVKAILKRHGITRILAKEGGRTSRGSIDIMSIYVDLLSSLAEQDLLNFEEIENWWVNRVEDHFKSEPLGLKIDASKSIRTIIGVD